MSSVQTVHIDFDRVVETLRSGVRRADVFMGVGLNASEQDPSISHVLFRDQDNVPQIRLVKEELNDDEKKHVAKEFGKWVRANGLRELLETFSIFMLELYRIIFLIRLHQKRLDRAFNKCRPEKFERLGIGDQIRRLAEIFSVPDDNIKIVSSLNRARNCYAHRRGLVGEPDSDQGLRTLDIAWSALQVQVKEDDGKVTLGEAVFGKRFEKGGDLQVAVIMRSRVFS
ncbi:MAG: hypothetical protein PSV22_04720, partial [Pseudolabrys sp.]|nr:hypothetical protein [Pseudolabrys sp.]